jgi:hypothetical protein
VDEYTTTSVAFFLGKVKHPPCSRWRGSGISCPSFNGLPPAENTRVGGGAFREEVFAGAAFRSDVC